MWDEGTRVVIPIWRTDVFGNNLQTSLKEKFEKLGGKVNDAVSQYGADKVGVHIVAFDEIVPIMIQANRHQDLQSVRWYGSDGSAQNEGLIKNVEAAEFAVKTNFLNPIYGVEASDSFNKLEER